MKIKEAFGEVINGYNINSSKVNDNCTMTYKTIQKDSIQYTNIIEKRLIDKTYSSEIKEKFFMHPRDILIFVKKPYRVGTYQRIISDYKVVIPNSFIILRNINMDYYSYIFVSNYLEKIGIDKYVKEKDIKGNLTIDDIENIELPDIPKANQMTISELLNAINMRSAVYSNILANDDQIIRHALNKVMSDKYD